MSERKLNWDEVVVAVRVLDSTLFSVVTRVIQK